MDNQLLKCGVVVKPRREYFFNDLDKWYRIDEFYTPFMTAAKSKKEKVNPASILLKMKPEEFKKLLSDILTDDEGKELTAEVINKIRIDEGLPIVIGFFLEYVELNLIMRNNLEKSNDELLVYSKKLQD